jgi:glycyl-tRNA synthetase (class II)
LNDQAVTIRHRDTMAQVRVPMTNIKKYIEDGFANWSRK